MTSVERVYPTAEDLQEINKNIPCPECGVILLTESHLNLHLAKTHKKPHLLQASGLSKVFHCPVGTCQYNNSAHFTQLKLLKQHYLKVHSNVRYNCDLCRKGFPTQAACKRHHEYCNVNFKCCDCNMSYGCYETLKTHSRRKKHTILEKTAYKAHSMKSNMKSKDLQDKGWANLLKTTGTGTQESTLEQSSQTDKAVQNSQETQTLLANRMSQLTQTINRRIDSFNPLKTVSCNTVDLGVVQQSSSSTQTTLNTSHIYSSTSTHDSIHTDTSDLLTSTLDSNFFNCNSETQTDLIFNDDLFNCDYSNMYTQTCEELFLDEIGLSNTYTQTVLNDVRKSVESQTSGVQGQKGFFNYRGDMTHMETQTDSSFRHLFEKINA